MILLRPLLLKNVFIMLPNNIQQKQDTIFILIIIALYQFISYFIKVEMKSTEFEDEAFQNEDNWDFKISIEKEKQNPQKKYQKDSMNLKLIFSIFIALFVLFNVLIYVYWEKQHNKISDADDQSQQKQQSVVSVNNTAIQIELQKTKDKIKELQKQVLNISQNLKKTKMQKQSQDQIINKLKDKINRLTKKWNQLPLQLPVINPKHQRIEDYLYPDQQTKLSRVNFYRQRTKFIDQSRKKNQSLLAYLHLAKYNIIIDEQEAKLARNDFDIEWERIQKRFRLSKITTELPMCIVSAGYNNNANFRIESSLNSIFTQNYTNYKAIIINDASNDSSGQIYRKYFQFYQIDKTRYTYIENKERITSLQNIYLATLNHCSKDSIVVTLDADDQFNGRNALKVFNWGYTTKKSGVLYSNYYFYQPPIKAKPGWTSEYSDDEKMNNLYRDVSMKFSQLRSFRAELLPKIPTEYFKDDDGKFFTITADLALYMPLMELSCGRVNKIVGQVHYIYNFGTGLNDALERPRQIEVEKKIRGMKKLPCDKEFNDRMKSLQ